MSDQVQETTDAVYALIRAYRAQHGNSPSQREIAQGCFLSQPAVIRHLDRLEMQGKIRREPGKARGIWLSDEV